MTDIKENMAVYISFLIDLALHTRIIEMLEIICRLELGNVVNLAYKRIVLDFKAKFIH